MELHIKIRAARHQFGFSQQYMADLLNISQKAYSKIESGKTALTIKRVTEIAKIFKIHPIELLFLDLNIVLGNQKIKSFDEPFVVKLLANSSKLIENYEMQLKVLEDKIKELESE
ncbi:MAG TPA: helix-turn-helix transcriptional regulator [Vicingaceae bacterium]|nr:helix-turn-helix transcriptional regulator [Vicingaceae bacterium]